MRGHGSQNCDSVSENGHRPPWDWFEENVPLLDVPDKEIKEIYYFRGYAFQKHIKDTPAGSVIDEFLDIVPWVGKFNTISAAAEHHIREARWLRNPKYAEDYTRFWVGPDAEPRRYSFAAADSAYQLYLATGNKRFAVNLLPEPCREVLVDSRRA